MGWALAALSALVAAGCGGPDAEHGQDKGRRPATGGAGSGRIVLVTNGNSDWWSAVEKGMKDAGAKFSADVEMKRNEGPGSRGRSGSWKRP